MDRTTDITKIRFSNMFSWGLIVVLYDVREYTIAEYHPWKVSGCTVKTGEPSDCISYHVWINGKDTARSYGTFDEAIVSAIAYKRDGSNSQAGRFFMKMVQPEAEA